MNLKTAYEIGRIPHAEHPMPQLQRENWQNLNGTWHFYKETASGEKVCEGEILVPFSPETQNSGIADGFVLQTGERLIYQRNVTVEPSVLAGRVFLHIGAADSECRVLVNGREAGTHRGGFTAFSFEITNLLTEGENTLLLECADEATRNGWGRGKQSDRRGGIWYTPQSGIWQTVWLEYTPRSYIHDLRITPNAEKKSVHLAAQSFGEQLTVTVFDEGREILRETFREEMTLAYDFALWSPENPKLYDFTLTNQSGDCVRSYFGVRSFGYTHDRNGVARLTLNGLPYFFNGVLDQGYWSDGLLTYPSDLAAYEELKMLKDMGFNTVRKHIKLEPMRWYYHCDRLGLVVWQDFVNGGGNYRFSHVAALPFLGFHHRDSDYRYFAREDEAARNAFLAEADETLRQLYNCVSIGVWVPFNEGWGQFDSEAMTAHIKALDTTRIVDSVSGWHDQGVGKTELKSLHTYYTPLKIPKDSRPVVLSEFGGYSMKTEGHVFDENKEFGYKKFKTQEALVEALSKLYLEKLLPLIAKGLCGCIYTQVSDVEEEINGLVTYDRRVIKVPVAAMRAINDRIRAEAERIV